MDQILKAEVIRMACKKRTLAIRKKNYEVEFQNNLTLKDENKNKNKNVKTKHLELTRVSLATRSQDKIGK
jgi:hypothetical protein